MNTLLLSILDYVLFMLWIWVLGRKYPRIKDIKILWLLPVIFWIFYFVLSMISHIQYTNPSCIRGLVEAIPLLFIIAAVGWALLNVLPMIVGMVMSFESVESQSVEIKNNISFNLLINLYLLFAFLSLLSNQMVFFVIMIFISIALLIRMIQGKEPYKQILSFILINMTLMTITDIYITQISYLVEASAGMLLSGILGCVFFVLSERYYLCKLSKYEQVLVFSGIIFAIFLLGVLFTIF